MPSNQLIQTPAEYVKTINRLRDRLVDLGKKYPKICRISEFEDVYGFVPDAALFLGEKNACSYAQGATALREAQAILRQRAA